MISSIITPFRWYNQYYQQHRFDVECKEVCDFKLLTDQHHLLPFQFKRSPSPNAVNLWILRKCCTDPFSQLLNETEQKFAKSWSSEGAWTPADCGGIKAVTDVGWANAKVCYEPGLDINTSYTIKFNIKQFDNGLQAPGLLGLNLYVNGVLQTSYQSEGYKTFTFTTPNIVGIVSICFEFVNNIASSAIVLDFVQITNNTFSFATGDVSLDTSLLKLKAYVGFDVISYCGAAFSNRIPPGCYYSMIRDEGGNYYYSEVITVDKFIPEKSPYFIFEWWNSCDMTDVIYTGTNGCTYKNRLYLPEAVLTRPNNPIKEEGEEDGNQNFNPTFQKWQKIISLFAYKVPEYILDALTAVRIHDNIQYTYPIREKQLVVDSPVTVKSVEHDQQPVINDCFYNVELKMLLNDQYVDSACCHNVILASKLIGFPIPEVGVEDPENYQYALKLQGGLGPLNYVVQKYNEETMLYETFGSYVAGVWTSDTIEVGTLIQDDSIGLLADVGAWEIKSNGIFFSPVITSVVKTTGFKWLFIGTLFNGVFGQVQSNRSGLWANEGLPFLDTEIAAGVEIEITVTPPVTYDVRIKQYDLNGNLYGYSATEELNEV